MPELEMAVGGSYARLKGEAVGPLSDISHGGIRGKVRGFSKGPRNATLYYRCKDRISREGKGTVL